jgi:ATP-binding cassette subfamily G (WHITE) protein 1
MSIYLFFFETATMTVKEAIKMSAILRLPSELGAEAKEERVNQIISILRLTKAANTIIGSTTIKGISGGERKRTALSMEMVTNPSILFLDEPTSGNSSTILPVLFDHS